MLSQEILKGTLKPLILKLIRENGRMYGYQITRLVRVLSDDEISLTEGALYPALHKLVNDGLLKVESERVGQRERKYYSLSPAGLKLVNQKIDEARDSIMTLARLFDVNTALYGA